MPTDHHAQVAELMADYRRSKERLSETHRELAAISARVRSADGRVEVEVGPRGVLRDVVLAADVYEKLRPPQLAATIRRLTQEAAHTVAGRAADVLAEVLPAGTDPELLLGEPEPPAAPVRAEPVQEAQPAAGARNSRSRFSDNDDEEDFSATSWLQQSPAKRT